MVRLDMSLRLGSRGQTEPCGLPLETLGHFGAVEAQIAALDRTVHDGLVGVNPRPFRGLSLVPVAGANCTGLRGGGGSLTTTRLRRGQR